MKRLLFSIVLFLIIASNCLALTAAEKWLVAASSGAAFTPTLVQVASFNQSEPTSGAGDVGSTSRTFPLPNPAGTGNCILVEIGVGNSGGQTISSVTDNESVSYSIIGAPLDYTSNKQVIALYTASATAGAQTITVTWSAGAHWTSCKIFEFYNCGSIDAYSSGSKVTSETITGGSLTPTQAGDLILQVGYQDSAGGPRAAIYAAGSQSNIAWALVPGSTNSYDGSYAQYGIYNSTAAINPTCSNTPNTDTYISLAVAIKATSAGTAPGSGIRVLSAQHMYTGVAGLDTVQFVTAGNLQVALSTSTNQISGITSSNSNSWQSRYVALGSGSATLAQVLDSVNATAGIQTLTVTYSTTTPGANDYVLLDVANATASPYDNTTYVAGQSQTSGAGTLNTGSITPNTTNELIVSSVAVDYNTLSTLTGSGQYALGSIESPFNDQTLSDENNGYGIFYNSSSTSAVTFIYNVTGSANSGLTGPWSSVMVAYK